jgi:precorrin-6B methylase 2
MTTKDEMRPVQTIARIAGFLKSRGSLLDFGAGSGSRRWQYAEHQPEGPTLARPH